MTLLEVKKGLLAKMKEAFPASKYKYYSTAVSEGFQRPCFFTQLKPTDTSPRNYNTRNMQATLYINFLQESADEAESLAVIQKTQDIFGLYVRIDKRIIHVINMDWDFIGKENNIPEIRIDLLWGEKIEHKNNLPVMEKADFNVEKGDS